MNKTNKSKSKIKESIYAMMVIVSIVKKREVKIVFCSFKQHRPWAKAQRAWALGPPKIANF